MEEQHFISLLTHWGIPFKRLRPDLVLNGSPGRCHCRVALESQSCEPYILEAVEGTKRLTRERQFSVLNQLHSSGFSDASLWLGTRDGKAGVWDGTHFWQLRRYLSDAVELPRDSYGSQKWRGEAAAGLLLRMRKASRKLKTDESTRPFFLREYIRTALLPEIARHTPALRQDVEPILEELDPFLMAEEDMQLEFAHGDFHPGNILWGTDRICGIIDWEFCGMKTSLYDLANLLGCLGMDEPAWMTGEMAMAIVSTLRSDGTYAPQACWENLPDLIAALRFGWLREWFVQGNKPMLLQELDFIWLVLDNRELLRKRYMG